MGIWEPGETHGPEIIPSPHGSLEQITLEFEPNRSPLRYALTFALAQDHPLLLWRLKIQNTSPHSVRLGRLELLRVGLPGIAQRTTTYSPGSIQGRFRGLIRPHAKGGELGFFSNGWQSWNYHGVYGQFEKPRSTRLGFIYQPMVLNAGTPLTRTRGHFTSEMFGILGNRTHRTGILAGFLSQKTHFGTLETWLDPLNPSLRLWANGDYARLDPGAQITTDWACLTTIHLDSPDPLGTYLDAVARENNLGTIPAKIPTGWCSWYHFSENISAKDIRANLAAAEELQDQAPLEVIQIDDGFATQSGDWDSFRSGFPQGLAPLAGEIREAGFTPGLWLAPFILDRRSEVARAHPDWLLRNRWRVPVNAGYNWGTFQTALDLSNPEARAHAAEVVRTAVHQWGFPYLKLDFLYAGALPGRHHDPTLTRAQVFRKGLEAVREAAGETAYLLGCGSPIGPSLGLVDAMRIGPDVYKIWHPQYRGIRLLFGKEPTIPAAINSLQGTLARAPLHRRWWVNDPDCLLLGPDTSLSLDEIRTLATTITLTGGSFFLSDHLPDLTSDRRQLLTALLPPMGEPPHIPDWFDQAPPARLQLDLSGPLGKWHLVALFNWASVTREIPFDPTDFFLDTNHRYWAREFWSGKIYEINGGPVPLDPIPPHGVALLALRRRISNIPQYLGSNLHISQGLEVATWQPGDSELSFELTRPGLAQGTIELTLPSEPDRVEFNRKPIVWEASAPGRISIPLKFDRRAGLQLAWNST
jgi:alpha-galactosidase